MTVEEGRRMFNGGQALSKHKFMADTSKKLIDMTGQLGDRQHIDQYLRDLIRAQRDASRQQMIERHDREL